MRWEIAVFEVKYHLRQPLFYITGAVFFLLAVLLVSTPAAEVFSSHSAAVHRNAPTTILLHLTVFSLLGLLVVTAFVASSVLRDFDLGTHAFFFTKPLRKADYLLGRFAGSTAVSVALILLAGVGMVVGTVVPWQDPSRLGPFSITPYLYGLVVLALPNLLAWGAVLFALAAWSRRLVVAYLGVVFVLIVQDYVEDLAGNFENLTLGSILEPFGLVALRGVIRYWTTAELNTTLPGLAGLLLYNRVAWLTAGALFLLLAYGRFSYSQATTRRRHIRPRTSGEAAEAAESRSFSALLPNPARGFAIVDRVRQLISQTRLETQLTLRSGPFLMLLLSGLVFVFSTAAITGSIRGTPVYPVTHMMLFAIRVGMGTFLTAIVVFYSGELVWRERSLRFAGVQDALPTPNWVSLGAKLATLVAVVFTVLGAGLTSTIAFQLTRGFTHLEPWLYTRGLLVTAYPFVLLAVLAVFVQVLAGNKFIGYLLTVTLLIVRQAAPALGIEHRLLRYGALPTLQYSDLNGFGPYATPFLWYGAYWGLAALLLLILSALCWTRGMDTSASARLRAARSRFRGPVPRAMAFTVVWFVLVGTYIFYNTNILNPYRSRETRQQRLAEYERLYDSYRDLPLPRLTAVRADVDIYPDRRAVAIRGSYRLENHLDQEIAVLPVSIGHRWEPHDYLPFGGRITLDRLDPGPHRLRVADDDLGFYVYELARPLPPGGVMEITFELSAENPGFKNHQIDQRIVGNGTFFVNQNLFPSLGYARSNELQDVRARRRHGLPPLQRAARANDMAARQRNYLHADWTVFDVTVSTSIDQIATGPGYLQREWIDGARRFFHYRTDAPIIDLVAFTSAAFEIIRDHWGDVEIEVYHHPGHAYNVERILAATKASLEYFTASFGPYPHRLLRIIEVPNYVGQTAFSLANTILVSESWGFLGRVRPGDIDMVSYVLAHEIAHQWWNHQVVPGDVQGATFIAEALSEYSALMAMERMVGPHQVRRFLRFELDRYLAARSEEQIAETPLMWVENQPYIHYNKGSLVMYALQDYVGEAAVNDALRRFLHAYAFRGPPYVSSLELRAYLEEAIPPAFGHLTTDLFESITLFDNRVTGATYRERPDGGYVVTLHVTTSKLRADGHGIEHPVALDDWIDIGVFAGGWRDGSTEAPLYLEKHRVTQAETVFELIVAERPRRAGIDPYNKLIDRNPADNVRRLTEAAESASTAATPASPIH